MNDPMISSQTSQVQTTAISEPVVEKKKSGGFGKVLGGILGGAVNVVAPGLGTVIGGAIRGGNSGASTADMEAMMQNQMRQSMELLSVQNRVQSQSQEFTTMSNLLKSKHESEMSAVNNFKS